MKKSKKLFLGVAVLFFIGLLIVGYDISRRTTFPGSKRLLEHELIGGDTSSVQLDSTTNNH